MGTPKDWKEGNSITLETGEKALQKDLNDRQLYCMFLYNDANKDQSANVRIKNGTTSAAYTVPGTTGGNGPASLVFFSGKNGSSAELYVRNSSKDAKITAYIGSVAWPKDGSINHVIKLGDKTTLDYKGRYFIKDGGGLTFEFILATTHTSAIMVHMSEKTAKVMAVKSRKGIVEGLITYLGDGVEGAVSLDVTERDDKTFDLDGVSGKQMVVMNANSKADSKTTTFKMSED